MRLSNFFLRFSLAASATASLCPILGPVFPAPKTLTSSSPFQSALQKLQTTIEDAFSGSNSSQGLVNPNNTYSIQIFSTSDKNTLFDFHHRGVGLVGNTTVDGDSIYRIASISKLFAVYLLLLEADQEIFSEKVTKYLPELEGKGYWDDITIGALASNTAGITAEPFDVTSLLGGDLSTLFPNVFPPLSANETSECRYGRNGCTREIFLEGLSSRRPVNLPNTTPGYSNAGFALLGLTLESLTNISYAENLRTLLIDPLNLTSTTAAAPLDLTHAVIPGNETVSAWDLDISDAAGAAMGGLYSTANDLTAMGRAILSSSLLPNATTRAWLKPTSFTSSILGSVGRPWEIYRAVLDAENNRVVDMYTKSGNLGAYGSILVLIPDFDVGIVVLNAGSGDTFPIALLTLLADELLPALDEAARQEADAKFAGTYTASNGLNSTVTLSTTPGVPGLTIEHWISNGTDVRTAIIGTGGLQMYPTNIESEDKREHSWRASFLSLPEGSGTFYACPSWFGIDRPTYGVYGVDEFVFHFHENGTVFGVEPKALKIVLEKE